MDQPPVPSQIPEGPLAAPAASTVEEPLRSSLSGALSWARDLIFSVLIAVVLILFIYQPVKVEGTSMMPGLTNNERIFINKFTFTFGMGNIHRGDTVVFYYPGDPSHDKSYIKRVIGLPGDRIRIQDGQVFVNGTAIKEPYVEPDYRDRVTWNGGKEDVVGKDDYFVLGDHRNSSSDSRSWGYVPKSDIYGKAVFVYWPLDKIGRVE
jgi:signal peptidase I